MIGKLPLYDWATCVFTRLLPSLYLLPELFEHQSM
jgi:hypothetical protein